MCKLSSAVSLQNHQVLQENSLERLQIGSFWWDLVGCWGSRVVANAEGSQSWLLLPSEPCGEAMHSVGLTWNGEEAVGLNVHKTTHTTDDEKMKKQKLLYLVFYLNLTQVKPLSQSGAKVFFFSDLDKKAEIQMTSCQLIYTRGVNEGWWCPVFRSLAPLCFADLCRKSPLR